MKTFLENGPNGVAPEPNPSTKNLVSAAPKKVPKCVPSFRTKFAVHWKTKHFGGPVPENVDTMRPDFRGPGIIPKRGNRNRRKQKFR